MNQLTILDNNPNDNKQACAEGCNAIPDGFIEVPALSDIDKKLDFMRQKTHDMGYRFVGRHSAMKVCTWTKHDIRGKDSCYKNKFYDITSSQCLQMTPVMFFCSFNCRHCWRNFDYMMPRQKEDWDDPKSIIDGCIREQRQMLTGFGGSDTADKEKLIKAQDPKHVAISLSGEPTMYPHLPEFVDEILARNMTAFLVSNGTYPEMIETLLNHQPTNLYISLYGTNKEMYKRAAVPMQKDFWERVMKSLSLINDFDTNTVIRLTLAKRINFEDPEGYARIIDAAGPKFIECKAFMAVGGSRKSMEYSDMPLHPEILEFAEQIEKHSSYHIIDQKKESRVVLLKR